MKLRNFTALRFLLGMTFFVSVMTLLIMASSSDILGIVIISAIINTFVLSSLFEWLVHGIIYHHKIKGLEFIYKIHAIHHFQVFPVQKYVQYESDYAHMYYDKETKKWRMAKTWFEEFKLKGAQIGMHFFISIFTIIIPLALLAQNTDYTITVLITSGVISWCLASVHGAIHTPRDRWFESTFWFQWLNHHHYIHHIDVYANINFMLPLADFIFGTRKAQLTQEEIDNNPAFENVYPVIRQEPCYG